jgi:hypothetical protein
MNSTNTVNINTVQEKSELEEAQFQKRNDDYMAFLKKKEEIRDEKYLTNKYKFDFPDDRMSRKEMILLKLSIDNYEELVPITRTKEYKKRHGLSL